MKKKKVNIISLGCSKNLVDSERLMAMLAGVGMDVVHEGDTVSRGDVAVSYTHLTLPTTSRV